jgi:hypothetical protein
MNLSLKVYYVDIDHNEICEIKKPNSKDIRDTFFEHLVDTQDFLYYDLEDLKSSDEVSESEIAQIKSLRIDKNSSLDFNAASNILYNASYGRHLLFVAYETNLSVLMQSYFFDVTQNTLSLDPKGYFLNSNRDACPYIQPSHSRISFRARFVPFCN